MSITSVKNHLSKYNKDKDIIILNESSATVLEAAHALNTLPERIAKTISLKNGDDKIILILMAGNMKLDNAKFKNTFGFKPRMLNKEEALIHTGHPVGGICPFGLKEESDIYLYISLKKYDTVFPACGSCNSAIELSIKELEEIIPTNKYVDVCKPID